MIINNLILLCKKNALDLKWKSRLKKMIKRYGELKLHLGCGDKHYDNMINCDFRATKAVDIIMDCSNLSRFKENSVTCIFAHAFFEHIYRSQQLPMLEDCFRILTKNGFLIILGIPDFRVVANWYINRNPGIPGYGKIFDLYHVYRYTHGDPEIAPSYWLEQLHKSLFDKEYIKLLLKKAGFSNYFIFNYCYPKEKIPLLLGLIASKTKISKSIRAILEPFKEYIGDVKDIII
jgi:predicted SAM-dependent methyltransferase